MASPLREGLDVIADAVDEWKEVARKLGSRDREELKRVSRLIEEARELGTTAALATSFVAGIAFLNCLDDRTEERLDEDSDALGNSVAALRDATQDVMDAIAAAAKKQLALEAASAAPREEYVECLGSFMENGFGYEHWQGNERTGA
jgi:hypothetical protein